MGIIIIYIQLLTDFENFLLHLFHPNIYFNAYFLILDYYLNELFGIRYFLKVYIFFRYDPFEETISPDTRMTFFKDKTNFEGDK